MAKKVRVGFIGTGGIARYQASILKAIEGVEVVAGADVSEDALDKFGKEAGVKQVFYDYKEMLRKVEMDAVSVCTPNVLHKDPTVAALLAGKDVLVEKPMAMNATEAQAMVDAAVETGRKLAIGFQWRLTPEAQVVKRYVDAGEIGRPLFVRVQALRRRGIPNWGVFGRKELQGGGPLIDIGVHIMELGHYLIGRPKATTASACMYTYIGNKPSRTLCQWNNWDYKTYTVEDLAIGLIRFEGGACMSVESSFVAHIEKDVFNVQIMGEKGGATFSPPRIFKDEAGLMVNVEPSFIGTESGFVRKMENWIAYVRGDAVTQCPAEDGLAVQKMLDGLYKSADDGREVDIL